MNGRPPDTGDAAFLGLNELLPPAALAEGEFAAARNNRARFGAMEPRLGVAKLPWTNRVTSAPASTPVPFGVIYGAGRFRDAQDVIWAIIAADGRIYRTREANGATELALPSGVQIDGPVTFEQTYNGLICFRGPSRSVLVLKTLDDGWKEITQEANAISGVGTENVADGTQPIPPAYRGSWIGGRLLVPHTTDTEKDLVGISDYLNATRYLPVRSQARINQGSSDELISVVPFGKAASSTTAVCFKANTIYALYGVQGALAAMVLDDVTLEYGLAGPKATAHVGRDEADMSDELWFLAAGKGIARITYDQDGRLGVSHVLPSDTAQKTINRINWAVAKTTATFALWDQKLYAALPLDDARCLGLTIIPTSAAYSGGGTYQKIVEPGATYHWTRNAKDASLINGAQTITESGPFVAAGVSVTLTGTPSVTVTAGLQRIWKDVNNAVLVFDFRTKRWQGVDDGPAIAVQDWLSLPMRGTDRLFFLGPDGFINLVEELYHDEAAIESLTSALTGFIPGSWGGYLEIPVTPGARYAYALNAVVSAIDNGTESIVQPAGVFTAQTSFIVWLGVPGVLSAAPLYAISHTVTPTDIDHDWTSRAYRTRLIRQRQVWAALNLETWWPSLNVYEVTEGVNEAIVRIQNRVKSRTIYERPFDKSPWVVTNINDDHGTRNREDYAVVISEKTLAIQDGVQPGAVYYVESPDVVSACSIDYNGSTYSNGQLFTGVPGVDTYTVLSGTPNVYPPGSYLWLGSNGVDPDLHQAWAEDVRLRGRGGQVQIRVQNRQGRCVTKSVGVFTVVADQRPGRRT